MGIILEACNFIKKETLAQVFSGGGGVGGGPGGGFTV